MGLNNSSAPQASKYVPPHMRNRSSGPRPDGPRPDGNANSGWAAWNSGDRAPRNRYVLKDRNVYGFPPSYMI